VAEAFRAALAEKIGLHGGVDGHQIIVLPGQIRIVGEFDRVDFEHQVTVHPPGREAPP
jgi:hypothetical protein